MFDAEELAKLPDKDLWAAFDGAENDSERLEIYSALKDRLWDKDEYNTIIGLSDRMCELAKELGDLETAGRHRYTQGSANFNIKSFPDAAQAYGLAAEIAAEIGDQVNLAQALWAQADSYLAMNDFENALTTALESAQIAESESRETLAGNAMFIHSKALYRLDREEEAILALEETRDFYRHAGNSNSVAEVDDYRVTVLEYLARYVEANEYLRSCLLVWESRKNNEWIAYTNRRLAWNLTKVDEYVDAIPYFEAAKNKYFEIDRISEIPECEYGIGSSYHHLGEHEKGIQFLTQARALADANGNDFYAIRSDMMRAVSLHTLERFEDAKVLNFKLLHTLENRKDHDYDDDAYLVRTRAADNALKLENWAEIIEILAKSPTNPEFVPQTQILIWRMSIKARALLKLSREDEAFAEVDAALKLTTEAFENWVTAFLYEVRGLVLIHKNKREGERDLAHAIALHLANGQDEIARTLSAHFMPSNENPFELDSSSLDDTSRENLGRSPAPSTAPRAN
jgi:tetratricopeptide (TPR) repeat protein